jgi:aminoglycoside phosphotransferase
MDDDVAAALAAGFPDRDVDAVEAAGVSWNETNETVRVAFSDGGAAYLKLAVDGDPAGVVTERAAVDYVRPRLDLAVPEVLACDPDAAVPYIATAPLDGRPLHEVTADDDADPAALARAVGVALAGVPALPAARHARVVGGGADGLELEPEPWPDLLLDTVDLLHERGPSDRFEGYREAVVAAVEANRDRLADAPAALLHGDPAGPNTFRTPDGFGFVDWEVAHVGDPAYELVRACDQQFAAASGEVPDDRRAAFHEGYRAVAGALPNGFEERRPVYEAVWFLTRVSYFDNYVDFLDESADEFATAVEGEMERRLDAVR